MKKLLFRGVCTALVTPFRDGSVDIPMVCRLLERQLQAGVSAIVICGTTGESPTLSDSEKQLLFREAKAYTGDRALILAGTGSNCTAHAVQLSRAAQDAGADGLLVVSPYYNKAEPLGLIRHYTAIARSVSLPVILYNVPSRTGVDIPVSVCRELSELPNVVGIKEASPDLRKIVRLSLECPGDFAVWSGNDDLLLPMAALGAQGVISVASNVLPQQMRRLTEAALGGSMEEAGQQFYRLAPLLDALFSEVNPIPVKAAMELAGLPCGGCRLPLTPLAPEKIRRLRELLLPLLEEEK